MANVVLWMLLAHAPARVRSETPTLVELSVRVDTAVAEGTECWSVEAVRARIMHYAAGTTRHADLRVELDVKANEVELRLLRGSQLLARRPLTNLPKGCTDRRDTVALATAMALEHAPEERATSPSSETAASSASSRDRAPDGRARPHAFESQSATATSAEQTTAAKEPTPLAATPTATQSSPETGLTSAPRPTAAPPPSAKERTAAQARSSEGSAPTPPFLHLHLGGRWLVNANPSPVFTATLGLELGFAHLLSVDLSGFVSSSANDRLAGGAATTRLFGGELLGCRAWSLGDLALQGCLGAAAGACLATGRNYPVGRPTTTLLWAAGLLRVALGWPRESAVSVRLVLLGHANIARPELRVDGSPMRLSPGWVGGSAGLDLLVTLR